MDQSEGRRNTPRASLRQDVGNGLRGLLMGSADIVPGVSGGTVALVLGIYERLVTAVSHVDRTLFRHLHRHQWRQAADHLDARFLVALGLGAGTGIVGLASVMNQLLVEHLTLTLAVFFGLIVASSWLVGRMIDRWSAGPALALAVGIAFAYWLVGQMPQQPPAGYAYLFLTGSIAICAMILPGISGAFIMLILGKYEDVTGAIRSMLHGDLGPSGEVPLTLAVFAGGCLLGLVLFSKFLRWLLARHESMTMALLCGFMAGSLRKIWPFKVEVDVHGSLGDPDIKHKFFENVLPATLDGEVIASVLLALAAAAAVLLVDRAARRGHEGVPLEAEDHEPRDRI